MAAAQLTNKEEIIIDTRLGQQTIEPEKIINFPQGLIGFENKQKFILLQIQPASPFIILQSIDNPKLGLLVADPYSFIKHYTVQLNDTEKTILQSEVHNLAILVTMTIPKGKPDLARLNLTGPILINYDTKIGLQVPQTNLETTSHVYLYHPGEEPILNK
ncbi:flagellar assembly protein FliW [Lawsonia intracellularis]|uniref:flagellar assembly protein FliW n=1 Tax=Lawsonia intracellularis TaxID=29546 RepID=UPI00215B8761|nr:flagellar assembly protein FliW [Lawsonia intracellularis]